jgi:hypothetical protein
MQKQYQCVKLRVFYMVVAAIDVAAGLTVLMTLGYVTPNWTMDFLVWHGEWAMRKG